MSRAPGRSRRHSLIDASGREGPDPLPVRRAAAAGPIGRLMVGRGPGSLRPAFAPDPGDVLDVDRRGGHVNSIGATATPKRRI